MKVSQDILNLYQLASRSDCTVLITGATGTGKTSLANEIHNNSRRKGRPFISINLATLHEGTLESELFGHEKGAFTGADKRRVGKLELSNGGTVFLDEIGELSPRLQARLLEFFQSKTITPLGCNREVCLDVRVIAATHRNLAKAVVQGTFREDLFHRLRVISIPLKSLKARTEEFDEIVHRCLYEISVRLGKSICKISEEAAEKIETYDWPGNIRELRNALEYAAQSTENTEIKLSDLPVWLFDSNSNLGEDGPDSQGNPVLGVAEIPLTLNYRATFESLEREYLKRALSRNAGRVNRTAHQIGLNKTTLLRRLRAYGIGYGYNYAIQKNNS